MKKLFQNIYLKITTFFLLRKLKKFGYKFIFVLFVSLFSSFVYAQDTFNSDIARFYGTYNNTSFDYGPQSYALLFTNNLSVMPYYDNNGTDIQMPLLSGSWEIRFYFLWEVQYNTPYDVSLYAGNVRATCDGVESFDVIDSFYNSNSQTYTQVMSYNCSQLDVNQNFSNFHFDFIPLSGTSNRITRFSIDQIKYGLYSDDPYEDILDSINDNGKLSNSLINDFNFDVGHYFDETGVLHFEQNWDSVMAWIMPHNDPSVEWESTCDFRNYLLQTVANPSQGLAAIAACIAVNNNDVLLALSAATDSFNSTLTTELADYLAQTLIDTSNVSYTNRDAVFVLENIINGWADNEDIDWDDLDYRINGTANQFVMNTMTDYVTINEKFTGFVITMLSLGVVGLILHRRGS